MDEVRKKVMQDLFAAPVVLLPAVGGMTCLMGAWANNGPVGLTLAGLAGLVIAGGAFVTRLIFGVEKMTEDAFKAVQEKERKEHEAELNELERKLSEDGDNRTTIILRDLRLLYDRFQTGRESGKFNSPAHEMIAEKVEDLYQACVKQLEHSYEMHMASLTIFSPTILDQRAKVVSEVAASIEMLGQTIEQFYVTPKGGDGDLKRARAELEQTLNAARSAQKRIDGGDISEEDMQKYEREGQR